MTRRPLLDRGASLERIPSRKEPWDIAVIGGGPTGMGIALDAASRGHDVVLLERHDFGKGTSSRSTKLVHGGVRYLQQGNVSLVMEAGSHDDDAGWFARHEMARTVEDVLARRTRLLFLDAQAALAKAPEVARALALALGRDEAWQQAELVAFAETAEHFLLPA